MKKIALFLLPLCVIAGSCSKTIKERLSYSITTYQDSALYDIYIPDSGSYTMPIQVKFLSGNTIDAVSISLAGLPANVKVTPDSFSALPTYVANFVFTSRNAVHGTYPITLTAYTQTTGYQTYTFNLTVIPADCASLFWGNLSSINACTGRKYLNSETGTNTSIKNNLSINNFAGYGPSVNVTVIFNGATDSLYIPLNNYGNGTILSGVGTFTTNSMIIYYTATSTPNGIAETCIDTLRK